MIDIHRRIIIFLNFVHHLGELLFHVVANEVHMIGLGEDGSQDVLLSLIVQYFPFVFDSILGFELAADRVISHCNLQNLEEEKGRLFDNEQTDVHHDRIEHTQIAKNLKLSLLIHG